MTSIPGADNADVPPIGGESLANTDLNEETIYSSLCLLNNPSFDNKEGNGHESEVVWNETDAENLSQTVIHSSAVASENNDGESVSTNGKISEEKEHDTCAPVVGSMPSATILDLPKCPKAKHAVRSTLADDSKLVKLSLPMNPINIMQSNAQFLNKSRNFLSFITEKSTNIMDKKLSHHLSTSYNNILKLTDSRLVGTKSSIEIHKDSSILPIASTSENDLIKAMTENRYNSDIIPRVEDLYMVDSNGVKVNDGSMERNEDSPQKSTENQNDTIVLEAAEQEISNLNLITENEPLSEGKCILENVEVNRIENIVLMTDTDCLIDTSGNVEGTGDINFVKSGTEPQDSITKMKPVEDQVDNAKFISNEESEIDSLSMEDSSGTLENPKNGLIHHPVYLTLVRDYAGVKKDNEKLAICVENLKKEIERLEAEKNGDVYAVQLETLEKTVDQLSSELKTVTTNYELLRKDYTAANKERESMVMKYVVSEKQLIDTQRARDSAERKVKEMTKEQELLQGKLRQIQGERTRICNILDGKCHELTDLHKETERLKEEVNVRDVKLKWAQNKLKSEMDVQKETQQKLDKATLRINEMKEECDLVRREAQEAIRRFQQSEENKAVTLDQQLKEQQARLIMERHVTEDKEILRLQLQKEVEVLKQRQQTLIEENNGLSLKIQDLERNRLSYESNLSNLKILADSRQKEIVDLVGKVSQLETVKLQLKHKEQCLSSTEAEVERLRRTNEELCSDMKYCRQREAQMLEFTQKLTDKNVRLQSEFTTIEARAKELELEQGPLRERIEALSTKVKSLEEVMAVERNSRAEECKTLFTKLEEQTERARILAQQLEDSQGENAVLKRKQQISMKEMTREIQQCRRRLEAFEVASPSNSLEKTSRTGSSTSLNAGELLNGALSDNSISGDHAIQSAEPDRQTLLDRIVKMQKINVRRAEKIDFLEEHTRTLTEELQNKSRIIQNYILHENFDAMGNNERDKNKAELARHGGIMASVYNQRVSDDNMTLELSLEINRKLQAVLEDTLLKNITLKDNIDTLGEEIAKLTMQNRER
ncbi:coiled-coil domain-containing protein 186 [Orussus abietinus]|uniref:coiled-coil domain-containing protein 186 n=1 Tax=Orussus abietinus TaxID=222816 RepID=UPI000626AE68|nr:coiled-coil domain-containing protein 186 [Orussus abietinus]